MTDISKRPEDSKMQRKIPFDVSLILFLVFSIQCSKTSPEQPETLLTPDEDVNTIDIKNAKMLLSGKVDLFDFSERLPAILIANIYRDGLFKTSIAGKLWSEVYNSPEIVKICIDDLNPVNIFLAGPF